MELEVKKEQRTTSSYLTVQLTSNTTGWRERAITIVWVVPVVSTVCINKSFFIFFFLLVMMLLGSRF